MNNKNTHEKGVAILTVMSSIVFLTLILASLTYETELNQIKTYNIQDKFQAKLTAESGINFALAKLKIYQKARNIIEKRKNSPITSGDLQSVLALPFVYPPTLPKDANIIQKNALEEFIEDTVLKGNLSVTINPVSGFLNPNNLRIKQSEDNKDEAEDEENKIVAYTEQQFINTLDKLIEEFKEDEKYEAYKIELENMDPYMMVKELKFFVNSFESFYDDEKADLMSLYSEKNATPKHAPLSSLSELYLLQGWNDLIIDAMKKRMNVHQVSIIPINELTEGQLKVFFPDITKEQLKEFFAYRDGDVENDRQANPFTSVEDFKDMIVGQLGAISEGDFSTLVSDLNAANIRFGVAGALYQVISRGEYGRSVYTIKAFIKLPLKPKPASNKSSNDKSQQNDQKANNNESPENKEDNPANKNEESSKPPPLQFFEPRIVEIEIL
ncbi:MAG: type II secretion system protein GspK [Halobacteriovoraceae bacterium]|nr:type II secretion system protein GspK [Halobacteriovoraceae bacterium]